MQTSSQINDLVAAMVKARGAFKPVVRSTPGQAGPRTYKYADLETLIDATFPALLEHGLVVLQAVDADSSSLISRLCHVSGQFVESGYPLDKQPTPQAYGSQLSYARRYSLLALLGVAQEDDDGSDASQEKPAPAPAAAAPRATPPSRPPTRGADLDLFCVTAVTTKPGKNARGAYVKYDVTFNDGIKASTFSESIGTLAEQLRRDGTDCRRTLERKGEFMNLMELAAVGPVVSLDVLNDVSALDDEMPF